MKAARLKITVEGPIANFLGVNIKRNGQSNIHLTQPQLIDSILSECNLNEINVKEKVTQLQPASFCICTQMYLPTMVTSTTNM